MDNNIVQFVGAPCGQHGPYTFYKAFRYKKNGIDKIVAISEFFFVKLWIDSDLVCIGELQLLWIDKNSEQVLASLRLYFLPENTPEGRMDHGEDELLAIAEKVVLRVEDLVTWITVDAEWTWGRLGTSSREVKEPPDSGQEDVTPVSLSESSLDFSDVEKDRKILDNEKEETGPSVVILSYPRYCRFRAMMKRLEGVENEYLKYNIVKALGGFSFKNKNTRVMFCKETFEYPELEGHEMLCNHLAPKLKGRPRGKRKKRSVSPGSESNESESSVSTSFKVKCIESSSSKNGICIDSSIPRRSTRSTDNSETKEFMKKLSAFMKMKRTPLGRAPCLGFKEIDLYEFYNKVQKLGGYDSVTSNRLWKSIFADMSGHQNSTGAATIVRRHYERFLLSYERHSRGEEYKPLPVSERRRLKTKSSSKSESESNEVSSVENEQCTPPNSAAPRNNPSRSSTETCPDSKEISPSPKQEGKTSSLRSVRVKPERQKEKFVKVVKMEDITLNATESLNIMNVDVKNEDLQESVITDEPKVEIKCESPIQIEKITEPLTSAVAPIVQKMNSPEKTPSPIECKENIPIINSGEVANTNDKEFIINVPCNQNSIKEIENILDESEKKPNEPDTFVDDIKIGKLDILKEGGLEVTPVRTIPPKDTRPSVIHNMSSPKSDQQMPPPKRLPISIPQSLNISKVPVAPKPNKTNNQYYPSKTPSTPPKVVQSRSIYSYSEKTVYGNPKDCLVSSYPVHTPKAPVNLKKQTGGDLLDLTVTSPQKPFVEMRIPTPSTAHSSNYTSKAANLPIFEGRKLGSNLEITLVDSSGKSAPYQQNPRISPQVNNYSYKAHNKRSHSENSGVKYQKIDENGKYSKPSTSSHYPRQDFVPHQYAFKPPLSRPEPNQMKAYNEAAQNPKNFPPGVAFPHYLSQMYEGNKSVTPYFPMIDPLLYSAAMQSLYPQSSMNPSPPFLQFATQEQLKLYSELMAQNSRIPFPFQLPSQDEFAHNAKKS